MPHPQAFTKSALGPTGNVTALLGYLIGVLSIVNIIIEKENNFVRFHAVQKLLFVAISTVLYFVIFIALFILTILIGIVGGVAVSAAGEAGGVIGLILYLITLLLWFGLPILFILIFLGCLIMSMVKAYQGEVFRIPIVGKFAAKIVPV